MLNWDIYTHPEEDTFGSTHTCEEKVKLADEWKEYMEKKNVWISFYVWLKAKDSEAVLKTDSASTSSHSWSAIDGRKIETTTTFPPFKGIVLGEGQHSTKAYPLIQKDESAIGVEGRIQKNSEQINWTNIAIIGLEKNVAKATIVKYQIDKV